MKDHGKLYPPPPPYDPFKIETERRVQQEIKLFAPHSSGKENKLNPAGEALMNVCVILTNIDDILLQTLSMTVLVTVLGMETVWLETATVFLALEDPTAAEVRFLCTYSSISLLFSVYYFWSFIPAIISASLSLSYTHFLFLTNIFMVTMFFTYV